jgi:transposase
VVENKPAILANLGYIETFNIKRLNTEPTPRRQVIMKRIKYIGLDVHKNSISTAIAEDNRNGEIRFYGKINNNMAALKKVIRKLISDGSELCFVYEAGPCGYKIYRYLTANNFDCIVCAPSLIPKKSGDRIKNDRRDAISLARLYRAGELTAVYVPNPDDEAMRDLTRAREDSTAFQRKSKQQLNAFLLRHGHIYNGKKNWSKAHFNWIADIKMEHQCQQITLQEYVDFVQTCIKRVERLTEQIIQLVDQWRMAPVVYALQALRGVSTIVAVTTVAELGDLSRFDHPSKLMAFLGLVPSEDSSGESTKRGPITKTGNGHVRRILVEAAHAYRFPARVTRPILKRQEGLPEEVREIAWKAQVRLCKRYRRMINNGKPYNLTITAIARELIAFMWAIVKATPQVV